MENGSGLRKRNYAISLFGRFEARAGLIIVRSLESRKLQELLGYLLLSRDRSHHREVVAGTLWPDSSPTQARKYLRQSLWQVRALESSGNGKGPLLHAGPEWLQVNSENVWLDVAQLEQAFAPVRATGGEQIESPHAGALKRAVPLYRGDLLESCFQDWCLAERER